PAPHRRHDRPPQPHSHWAESSRSSEAHEFLDASLGDRPQATGHRSASSYPSRSLFERVGKEISARVGGWPTAYALCPVPCALCPVPYEPVANARSASVTTAMTLMVMIPISLRTTARASST